MNPKEKRKHFGDQLKKTWSPDKIDDDFQKFLKLKFRIYFSANQWMEDSMKFDFSLGFRLHGNMAAWQVGVPSLWITHDVRTSGLVNSMKLPSISCEEFIKECSTLDSAWNFLRANYNEKIYTKRRIYLENNFIKVFQKYNLSYDKIY